MSLDLTRTVAQLEAAAAVARGGAGRRRQRLEVALESLRSADTANLRARAAASQGMFAFLPAEAVEAPGLTHPPPPSPADFAVVATDGSHIDVDRHLPLRCYLVNTGGCILEYGASPDAHLFSAPRLATADADLYLSDDSSLTDSLPVEGALLGLLRSVEEVEALADAVERAPAHLPTLGLLDGTLVLWALGGAGPPGGRYADHVRRRLLDDGLLAALDRLQALARTRALAVASYISLPNSSEVANLLRLALCDHDPLGDCRAHCRAVLPGQRSCDAVHGFTDRDLFSLHLAPGERSALFGSRSPVVRDRYGPHHVRFFYLNVGDEIARVEVPAWVAEEPRLLGLAHALALDSARRGAGYPVALQEAHEQAVISGADRDAFRSMVERALEAERLPVYTSEKQRSKLRRWV